MAEMVCLSIILVRIEPELCILPALALCCCSEGKGSNCNSLRAYLNASDCCPSQLLPPCR